MKTLVLIPAYNEEITVNRIVSKIKELYPELDILVVNDGSNDATARVAKTSGASVISHLYNMGYGVGLQTGYKYALKYGYDFVIQIDADGQHDPMYIGNLLDEIKSGSVDLVIGSRFISAEKYKASSCRQVGMFLFSSLVSLIIRRKMTDSTSGFQAMNKSVIDFFASDIFPVDYPDADVIIMLHRAGFRIKEIPTVIFKSKTNKSMHSGIKPIYYVFKMILSIVVTLLRKKESSSRKKKGDEHAY